MRSGEKESLLDPPSLYHDDLTDLNPSGPVKGANMPLVYNYVEAIPLILKIRQMLDNVELELDKIDLKYSKYAPMPSKYAIDTPPHLHDGLMDQHYVHGELVIPESSRAHANNMNRFRSVCTIGIILTLIFGGCIGYLTNRNYLMFDVGAPVLFGLSGILIVFLDGLRRNK